MTPKHNQNNVLDPAPSCKKELHGEHNWERAYDSNHRVVMVCTHCNERYLPE